MRKVILKTTLASSGKLTIDRGRIRFPDNTLSNIPSSEDDDGNSWLIISDSHKDELAVQQKGSKYYIEANKWDHIAHSLEECVSFLNTKGYTEYSGVDDR